MAQRKMLALTLSRLCCIPQRHLMTFFGLTAIMNCYTMRNSLSITITQLVKARNYTDEDYHPSGVCEEQEVDHAPERKGGDFDWDQSMQGHILAAFFIGYFITHLPGGIISDIYGPKWVLNVGICLSAVFTFITPVMINAGGGVALIGVRVCIGLCQGVAFPACSALLARWAPPNERSLLGAIIMSGGLLGQTIGQVISAAILTYHQWPWIFFIFGASGLMWSFFFTILGFNDPYQHPCITQLEQENLDTDIGVVGVGSLKKFPWSAMFYSDAVMALICCQLGHDWGLYVMATDLPKYMHDVLQFHVLYTGIYSSTPFFCMWLTSIISGSISDWLIRSERMTITRTRKLMTIIAQVGPGAFMLAASYAGCERVMVVALFTVALAFMGPYFCGLKLSPVDLSPNFAGTLMAISNGLGALCGYIAPWLVGFMTPNTTLNEWRGIFQLAFAILCCTGVVFCLWGSGEVQQWNEGVKDEDEIETK